MKKALFEGLVLDEAGNALPVAYVGQDPTYVLVEDGFKYHVDARRVDEQVLNAFREHVQQNEALVSEGVLRLLGRDDLFTKAAVDQQIRHLDQHFAQLFEVGIPEQVRRYLGMLGFSIIINRHGEVVDLKMPSAPIDSEGE
ncbi:MAG: hypothetical protein NZM18_05715 [Thermoflexales bacterium]|nr:hypothetical protein [Thermoflexales bacterium]MDW8350929.1 hypothetical protein [Anaerolineae bacterium]